MPPEPRRGSAFPAALALGALLLTAVICQSIWDSYFPPFRREALRQRRSYYEKVLKKADLSWEEGLYFKVLGAEGERRRSSLPHPHQGQGSLGQRRCWLLHGGRSSQQEQEGHRRCGSPCCGGRRRMQRDKSGAKRIRPRW